MVGQQLRSREEPRESHSRMPGPRRQTVTAPILLTSPARNHLPLYHRLDIRSRPRVHGAPPWEWGSQCNALCSGYLRSLQTLVFDRRGKRVSGNTTLVNRSCTVVRRASALHHQPRLQLLRIVRLYIGSWRPRNPGLRHKVCSLRLLLYSEGSFL